MARTAPFSRFEWLIAWRYLRASRAEGGISAMTWISLIGIMLGVAALIITLAVRTGFRAELVDTILGANAHVTVYQWGEMPGGQGPERVINDYEGLAQSIRALPGVTRAAPLVRGEVLADAVGGSTGAQVYGIRADDLMTIPRVAKPNKSQGDITRFGVQGDTGTGPGIAIGSGVAAQLGVITGDRVRLISPDGAVTPFGVKPRASSFEVAYIFTAGRYDIDRTRVYIPLAEAQRFFNRDGVATEIEVMTDAPEEIERLTPDLLALVGDGQIWTWLDASGGYLRALEVEDNVMFVILSVLVLIATMNIVSGLIMLVKNKGRDIGILRTMGLTEGSVLRVFFLCGAMTGIVGTLAGVLVGCAFALSIDQIFALVNYVSGGGVWDPQIRGIYALPAELRAGDVLTAVALSLGLSFVITWFPARRAARLNPVEALRFG